MINGQLTLTKDEHTKILEALRSRKSCVLEINGVVIKLRLSIVLLGAPSNILDYEGTPLFPGITAFQAVPVRRSYCKICKTELNTSNPATEDHGGDCLKCMGRDTMKLPGKVCGTCNLWERKFATSSRTGKIIPNARCKCNAAVKLNPKLPYSIQMVATLCEDGINCPAWEDFGEDLEMIDP